MWALVLGIVVALCLIVPGGFVTVAFFGIVFLPIWLALYFLLVIVWSCFTGK